MELPDVGEGSTPGVALAAALELGLELVLLPQAAANKTSTTTAANANSIGFAPRPRICNLLSITSTSLVSTMGRCCRPALARTGSRLAQDLGLGRVVARRRKDHGSTEMARVVRVESLAFGQRDRQALCHDELDHGVALAESKRLDPDHP